MDTDWNRLGINMTKVRRIILEKDSYKKDDNIIFDFKFEHFKYVFQLYLFLNLLAIFLYIIEISFYMDVIFQ